MILNLVWSCRFKQRFKFQHRYSDTQNLIGRYIKTIFISWENLNKFAWQLNFKNLARARPHTFQLTPPPSFHIYGSTLALTDFMYLKQDTTYYSSCNSTI